MSDNSFFPDAPPPTPRTDAAYRVLARKYRPSNFEELIGQDALVRTLTNAFEQNRIAHAFMLTGVRGVGKTTTARIIARALNCIGADGKGGPTITPCGVCTNCVAIAADRHVDVMEMDAASRTGIDDIRELIDGVRYAPGMARYKVYIIDEVHMLSKQAFNALLKTLEEPPPHVKFVFATTEIRKVPITVLSRCQRFDLRRVDSGVLSSHFAKIAAAEEVAIEPGALALIARAADGSVRDGLSLLDQAIALGGDTVKAEQVRDMLGFADRAVVLDLFEATMGGEVPQALDILSRLHAVGADPAQIIEDLLELTHRLTRLRLAPDDAGGGTADWEMARGQKLVERLTMPILTRAWQLLLKGLGEVQTAPHPQAAAEMVVLRLAYAADLPTPGDVIKQIQASGGATQAARPTAPTPAPASRSGGSSSSGGATLARAEPMAAPTEETQPLIEAVAVAVVVAEELPQPGNFREIVKLFAAKREGLLEYHLASSVRLVRFEAGVIEINPMSSAPPNLANRVGTLLSGWTGRRWVVGISSAPGEPTLAEVDATNRAASFDAARNGPTVQALMEAFPGATITDVRELGPAPVQTDSPVDDDQMNDLGDIEIIETILEPGDDS